MRRGITRQRVRRGLGAAFGLADFGEEPDDGHAAQGEERAKFGCVFRGAIGEGYAGDEECDGEADTGSGTQDEQVFVAHALRQPEDFSGDAAEGEDAEGFAQDEGQGDAGGWEADRRESDAGAGPSEEAQNDFSRDVEGGLEFVERVIFAAFVIGVDAIVFGGVGHTDDDGDEAQGAVDAGVSEAEPRQEHEDEIGGPAVPLEFFVEQEVTDSHEGSDAAQAEDCVQAEAATEGNGDDDEAHGVVGNGEQEEEGHGGVLSAEDEAGDHGAESDVSGRGHGPAVHQVVGGSGAHFVAECAVEEKSDEKVDGNGAHHAAGRGDEGRQGLFGVMECAAGECGFEDFFAGSHKEEGHQKVIDEKVEVEVFHPGGFAGVIEDFGAVDRVIHEAEVGVQDFVIEVICSITAVCPDKRYHGTYDQQ